jgi:hypothetical protein
MSQIAFVIGEESEAPIRHIGNILDLFGIPWRALSPSALTEGIAPKKPYVVFCAMPVLGRVLSQTGSGGMPAFLNEAHSVFLYGAGSDEASRRVLSELGLVSTSVIETNAQTTLCEIHAADVCGAMARLKVSVPSVHARFLTAAAGLDPLISTNEGIAIAALHFRGKPYYIACSDVIDISQPVRKGHFDITDYFFSAVPIVMYLRHSFKDMCLSPAEYGACLIIDDPVLRPNYGFVNFKKLSQAVLDHNFSCNIAFIPWNWRRSQRAVLDLFKTHSDRLSISIHGCDHTAGEFATKNTISLNAQAKLAHVRMQKHAKRTGLPYDPLMVFPQGAFSSAAAPVLKHNGFMAAVNTEVLPTDVPSGTQIRDTWQMAILRYGNFPIFTRRYAFHGLHNFAFDLLLGKPCLMVTHHADFRNDSIDVLGFIDRLNALPVGLKWRPLGEVIRHAYQLKTGNGVSKVRMFGSEVILGNNDRSSHRVVVEKVASDADMIERIEVNGQRTAFSPDDGLIRFEAELPAGSTGMVRVVFKDIYGSQGSSRPLIARSKVAVRRYLSEFRDESQARAPFVYAFAGKARTWLAGTTQQ